MLLLLDHDQRRANLRGLLRRYRAQEAALREALDALQARLELEHRAASTRQLCAEADAALLQRCRDMQFDYDDLATELVHVRMAVLGTAEELEAHEREQTQPLLDTAV